MTASDSGASEIRDLALTRMSKVLGPDRARQLMNKLLGELGIDLRSPDDLLQFADALSRLGGFEGAVGAMLGVTAVLRGATRKRERLSAY